MDPLFERRQLVRNIHVESRFLQRNMVASLLSHLRMKYEGVCVAEGFIARNSITVLEHSLGRANLIKGGLDYTVKFEADICMPHQGQVFRAPVSFKSKIGLHAEMAPLKVMIPRDLHIGNAEFDEAAEKQEIEFEVVGARYQQGDDSIVVLAKLRTLIRPVLEDTPVIQEAVDTQPMIAAPVGQTEGSEKKVVTVAVDSTKVAQPTRPKRIRLNPAATTKDATNVAQP